MSNEPSAHRHTARSLQGLCMRAAVRLRRNRSVGLLEPWRVQSARTQQCTRRFSIITRRLDHRGSWRSGGGGGGAAACFRQRTLARPPRAGSCSPHPQSRLRNTPTAQQPTQRVFPNESHRAFVLGGAQAARPLRIREEVAPRYAPAMLLTRFPTVETGLLYISTAHTHTTTLNNSQHFGLGFLAARLCGGRGEAGRSHERGSGWGRRQC